MWQASHSSGIVADGYLRLRRVIGPWMRKRVADELASRRDAATTPDERREVEREIEQTAARRSAASAPKYGLY